MPTTRMTDSNLAALRSVYLCPVEKILWVVCLLLWLGGIFLSAWILIPAVLVTLYTGALSYTSTFPRWKSLYNRISMTYAYVAGAHAAACQEQGIPFDPDMAWRPILQELYESDDAVEKFLSFRDCWRLDGDRASFERVMVRVDPAASKTQIDSRVDHFQAVIQDEQPSRKVMATKGFLIKQHFSAKEYESFWVEVLRGRLQ